MTFTRRILSLAAWLFFSMMMLLSATAAQNHQKKPVQMQLEQQLQTECLATNEELSSFHCLPAVPPRIPCIDAEKDQCPVWAERGECSKNPQYMMVHCRKSCQTCITFHQGGVTQIAPSEENRRQVLERLAGTQEYQHWQAERSVESLKTCINKHELCTHWSLTGECETNAHYMNRECPAACRSC